jgi:glycosyltransferase involved in cell wall biosynthesis
VEIQVLVVDDGSASEAPTGLPGLDDPRVRVVRQFPAKGVASARNIGLAIARAPWVAFLDDDDIWAPTKLSEQLDAAEPSGAEWAYGAALHVDPSLRVLELVRPVPAAAIRAELRLRDAVPGSASMVVARRDALLELGGFDERLAHLADWDLWLRLAARSEPGVCENVLMAYVEHPGGMHVRRAAGIAADFKLLAEKHGDEEPRLGSVEYSRWLAACLRKDGHRRAAARVYLSGSVRYRNSGNAVRAAAVLLGERATGFGRRRAAAEPVPPPAWLTALTCQPDPGSQAHVPRS